MSENSKQMSENSKQMSEDSKQMPEDSREMSEDSRQIEDAVKQTTADVVRQVKDKSTVGIGVDIVEIANVEKIIERTPHFMERNFTDEERAYCNSKANPNTHFALHFAAKEAVLKALGTGFSEGIGITDVQVGHNRYGRPTVILQGKAAEIADELNIDEVYVSLSYTHTTGVASAVAARKEHMPIKEETPDARKILAEQFKEMRNILDDIDNEISEQNNEVTNKSSDEGTNESSDEGTNKSALFDERGEE